MNPLLHWLTSPEWAHVVVALLHSLWQGALVALVLALLMRRLTNPLTRYRCALSALGIIVIAGLITWGILNAPKTVPNPIPSVANELITAPAAPEGFSPNPGNKIVVIAPMTQPEAQPNWTTWLAMLWMTGAVIMLLRAGVKVTGAEKLRRSCQPLADENIAALVAEACRAVGLARKIRVAVTDKLTSPAVVGVLMPTLILPLSLFTTLTPTQIQFVLLHELAHIRRGDYLANLFQLFAEALLFFNPAVWWISHQIRREREACCDALAIELSGAPADYARTLVRVAENILQPAPAAAPAFGDDGREPSSLADRVQRLVVPGYRPALRLTWRAMATSLLVGFTLLVLSAVGTRNTVGAILSSTQSPTNLTQAELNQSLSRTNQTAHDGTNTIALGELIVVTFSGITEPPPPHEERVKPDGSIHLPNIGRVVAAGKSSSQLQQEIHDAYVPTFYKRLAISVKVETNAALMFQSRNLTTRVAVGDFTKFGVNEFRADRIEFNHQTQEMIAQREVRFRSQATQDWFRDWTTNAAISSTATATNNSREPLFTRTFNLPPEVLYGKIITNLAPTAMSGPAKDVKGEDAQTASAGFRAWIRRLGVDLDPQLGRSVFYNNRGGLFVRATMAELDIIEDAVMKLNFNSIELTTRTFQVEPTTIAKAIEATVPEFKSGAATNVTAGLRALFLSAGVDLTLPKSLFYNDRAGGLFVRATKEDLDTIESLLQVIGQQPAQVNIKAVFVEIPLGKDQPKALAGILARVTPENGTNFTGILTAPQFKLILRALETNAAARILADPQVTTLSGRQAQMQVADVKTIVSGMIAVVTNGMTNLVYQSQAMQFGPVLDVLPTVSSDGYTIQMTIIPTITEFLGYEDAKKLKLPSPDDKGTLPLPVLRKRQITTSASVWDGQTIVLGNFSDQMLDAPSDLKVTPKASGKKQSKQLLVFVTPTIIDPAGNPANKDMGIPSRLLGR